jgi:hypothetical protein
MTDVPAVHVSGLGWLPYNLWGCGLSAEGLLAILLCMFVKECMFVPPIWKNKRIADFT